MSDVTDPSEVLIKGHDAGISSREWGTMVWLERHHAGVGGQGVGDAVGLYSGVKVHPEPGVALKLMICNLIRQRKT